ncbi:hypothetical protein KPH14_005530 [Odynerus spinipes]|uniref:Fanconi anemia group M protein n=1 Tax=Odynerus spinipes TaxID=1348599 RepID=A0AAD9RCQ9_9HYME|nr:hypothetical protein KPH14_005530 [Odynerus spinipes]
MESTQDPNTSIDPETNGFDLSAGTTWIYPENYPLRDYQFNIVQTALYNNTLVCLPTGLGKTFIAAVIMYNFWRWYPRGKIIFLAPTRPLVAQQIDACHNIMGIPSTESIELTGGINQKTRQTAWFKKRVFFATPQVFYNDLENNIIPSELVKCVVIDEAHKALGKHSYCECIRILSEQNQHFRILALSATPGNKIANVHQVVQNLHISNIELRDETSPDIVPYVNNRKIDIILVPLGEELKKYKERYINIMDRHVKRLIQCKVIHGQTANISKGKIFIILREFQKKTDRSANHGQIIKTLNILLTMYHAYELMIRHGLRAFYKFYQNHSDKFWMNSECELQELITDIETYLGPFPNVQQLSSEDTQNVPDIPNNLIFGHNKFLKLKELLLQHFQKASSIGSNTRAIVFVEYRDIVSEVYILLLQARPLIRPQMFVGQAEQKQKKQVKAIEDFRNNSVNVLISTSIGEEGLDVGEVDLIICFDISQKSPTRLVQRMGRTGRRRDGHIIVLVTDGKEHETLKSTMAGRESLNSKILNTSNIFSSLYQNNPRMIPSTCTPQCRKIYINIQSKIPVNKGKKPKKVNNKKINETSTKKIKNSKPLFSNEIKYVNQSLKTNFLINTKNNEQLDDDDNNDNIELVQPAIIATTNKQNINNFMKSLNGQLLTCNNKTNAIKASNVKLLTCDNQAIDFLTLCAMKESEKEMTPKVSKMDTTYTSIPKPITNCLDFTVPSINILDDLANYLINVKDSKLLPEEDSQIDYDNNEDLWCNNQCNIISLVNKTQNEYINDNKSKFEDLLDESSASDEAVFTADKKDVNDEDNNINTKHSTVTNIKSTTTLDNGNDLNENHDLSMDAETSIFEDIFNDSFDSIDNDSNADNIENNKLKKVDSHRDSLEIVTSNKLAKEEDNVVSHKIQGKDHSKNETMFTITQAIQEMKRINSNGDVQPVVAGIKDTVQYAAQTSKDTLATGILSVQNINVNDYLSEEDMFASELDEDFDISIMNNESSNKENLKNDNLSDAEHKNINQIKINDTKCKTDFEVLSSSVVNSKNVNNSTNVSLQNTNTAVSSFANDIMWEDDIDSDEWISFDAHAESRKNKKDDSMKLAKKLSMKRCSVSNSTSINHLMEERNNSDSDLIIDTNDMEKLNDLETSYFSETKILKAQNCNTSLASASNYKDISFDKVKTQEMLLKNFSAFKAPNKYLKNQPNNQLVNTRPSPSNHTKLSRNFSYDSGKSVKQRNKNKVQCKYIDNEAEVSFDNTSDESSGTDEDLPGFVSYTQHVQDEVDMHAVYLQDIKSPVKRHGAFIFKEPQIPQEDVDVYSQPCSQNDQTYLQDSFCVGSDYEELEESKLVHKNSILEEAERKLEQRKRKRNKSDRSESSVWKRRKRRNRIEVLNTSTSSEDETEKLRKEIGDESMVLKDYQGLCYISRTHEIFVSIRTSFSRQEPSEKKENVVHLFADLQQRTFSSI